MYTILIPTINRSDFLIKHIKYLRDSNFTGQLLIGDSSNKKHYEITSNFIKSTDYKFEIKQYSFPDHLAHKCIQKMLKDIKYPYCTNTNDDDLLIINTLDKCVKILDNNTDFSAVGGLSIGCIINSKNYSTIDSVVKYKIHEVFEDKATKRVDYLFSNYSLVYYSLARTIQFKERWPYEVNNQNKGIAIEYLPAGVIAAQGKIKMLNDLFVVRQIHERRILLPTYFDNFLAENWSLNVNYAIEYLSKMTAKIDSIPYEVSYPEIKNSFKKYYTKSVINGIKKEAIINKRLEQSKYNVIKTFLKSIPGLLKFRTYLHYLNSLFTAKYGKISLHAMLNTSSPYYEDFSPVYKIITKDNEN